MRASITNGRAVAAQFVLCGLFFGLANGPADAQVVSLSSYNSLAAWEVAAAGLPEVPLIPYENFNSVPPESFDPLNPLPYQVGPLSIDFNLLPFNTTFNVGTGHPPFYVDGSPALRGNFIDPTESIVITFPEPVFGFAFKIQRPTTPASFPALAVNVQGTVAPPIPAVAPPSGFYGIVDTGGGSFQSITLSGIVPGQSFVIDDFYFLVPDNIDPPAPETKSWITPSSGIFGINGNWDLGSPPDFDDTANFNLPGQTVTVGFNTNVNNDRLMVRNGNVTFDLGGHAYELTNPNTSYFDLTDDLSVIVGNLNGDNAMLTLSDGTLQSVQARIGNEPGSQGHVTINDASWNLSDYLHVGYQGAGELTVENGGIVESAGGSISSQGSVTVTGNSSTWTTSFGGLNVDGGSMAISAGATVYASEAGIESQATVTVTGNGSSMSTYELYINRSSGSDGTLRVETGAMVTTSNLFTALSSLEGDGIIIADSVVLGGVDLHFDSTHGAQQTIAFGNGGQLHFDLEETNYGRFGIGHKETGTLTVAEGRTISTDIGYVGVYGGHGIASITGEGTAWNNSWSTLIGYFDGSQGELTIQDGGTLTNYRYGVIGGSGGQGTVTVTGNGSTWRSIDASSEFTIGGSSLFGGQGELIVEDGGTVETVDSYIGRQDGSEGTATVTGGGSTWTNSGNLILGGTSLTTSTTATGTLTVSDGGTVNVGGTLRIHTGDTVNLQTGGTIYTQHLNPTGGTFNFSGGTLAITGDVTGNLNVPLLGTLKGDGTVLGSVVNAGLVAPGFSPEIIHINGHYTQTATGRLEIEIGGLTPGTQHDRLQVTGTANLAGQLKLSLIDGYVPSANDEIIAIQAASISGTFSSIAPPTLDAEGNIAVEYVYNATDMRIRFVGTNNTIQFVRNTEGTTNWADPLNWSSGSVPGSPHIVELQNLAAAGVQRLEVKEDINFPNSVNAFIHRAVVEGTPNDNMTLAVFSNFSATTDLTAANNGVIELNSGSIAAANVNIQGGGTMTGTGTVYANVAVGAVAGEAMLSPGLSGNGHLEVSGNYQQNTGGTMLIDVAGDESGEFDTVAVSGALQLGGTLRIDATNLTMPAPGTTFEILAAGSLAEGEVFDSVETIGNDDIFFAPIYATGTGPGSGSEGGSGGTINPRVAVGVYNNGDMNRNGLIDQPDVQAFAVALTKPINYFSSFYIFGNESGDLNHDGRLDFDDIEGFAALVQGTGATAGDIARAIERELNPVPEPSSALLIICGMAILMAIQSHRFRRLGGARSAWHSS